MIVVRRKVKSTQYPVPAAEQALWTRLNLFKPCMIIFEMKDDDDRDDDDGDDDDHDEGRS